MFKPKYTITTVILNNLVKTAGAKAMIDNVYLISKWEVALRREALIRNAHASEQVSELARGRDIMATRKAKTEVVNYLKVLEDLSNLSEGGKVTEKVILKIHRLLTKDVLDNPAGCGLLMVMDEQQGR